MRHPGLTDDDVANEWRRRCDLFLARQQKLWRIALVWLGAIVALGVQGVVDWPNGYAVGTWAVAAVVGFTGFGALMVADLGAGRVLRCPRCGLSPLAPSFRPRNKLEIDCCDHCLAPMKLVEHAQPRRAECAP
jgi:hypothetical protein